jgi:hypothetical protein
MATSEEYAAWIVKNADKRGTEDFNAVVAAYEVTKKEEEQVAQPVAAPVAEPSTMQQLGRQAGLAGRAIATGVLSPATMVGDLLAGGVNLAQTSQVRYPSQMVQEGLTAIGLPSPETMPERISQAGMEAMTSTTGLAKIAPKSIFGQSLEAQIPAAAASSMAAVPVAEQVKKVTGSDAAATLAALGVGILAGGAAAKTSQYFLESGVPKVTIQDIRDRSTESYRSVNDAGIVLSSNGSNALFNKIKNDLDKNLFLPENAIPVKNVLNQIEGVYSRGNVKFSDIDQTRQMANNLLKNSDQQVRFFAKTMISSIDDYIAQLSPKDVVAGASGVDDAVKKIMAARKDWRNQSRATTLENILDVADAKALDRSKSESELIRSGFINLYANKDKMKLFTSDEQAAIRRVAKGGSLDPLLSFVSRFSPERAPITGTALAIGGPTAGYSFLAGLPVAGIAADALQQKLRQSQARTVISGLLSGTTPKPPPSVNVFGQNIEAQTPVSLFSAGIGLQNQRK